jgi:5-enolpyruvylshikimate-3-phosphate synthase
VTDTRQSIAEPPRFFTGESGLKIRLLIALLLLVGFSLVFYSGGSALAETPAFSENDVLFQLVTQRTVNDITYYVG